MLRITPGGSTRNTDSFLSAMVRGVQYSGIEAQAQRGVDALRAATPVDTHLTSESWSCEVITEGSGVTIWWKNSNVVDGFNVAIGLQYGHGTGTGGWIEGEDYINPSLRRIFDDIANNVWKEVQNA